MKKCDNASCTAKVPDDMKVCVRHWYEDPAWVAKRDTMVDKTHQSLEAQ